MLEKKLVGSRVGSFDERETAKTREGGVFHGDIAAALTSSRRLRRQSEAREEEQVRNSLR